jgi:hypothetical protein
MLAVAAAGVVLLVAVMMARDRDGGATVAPARAGTTAASPSDKVGVTGLKLDRLQQDRAALDAPERDPFRFQARPAPPRPAGPPRAAAPTGPVAAVPVVPQGPPPPPPIALRFIGLVEAPSQAGRVAILSDGRGNIFYGKEGDTIEGRYRVVKLGPEVVELAYVDGRGRQTIRLSGQ